MIKKVLSIAGFDGSGGAGIQADLKTFSAFGCYGMTVLTALPVQNTCGVRKCYPIPPESIQEQLQSIFDDIVPDSIKIGMLFNAEIIELVSEFLAENSKEIPIVLDPVMISSSGHSLLALDAVDALKSKLLPLVTVLTPNLSEACELIGRKQQPIKSREDMIDVAKEVLNLGPKAVLLKGGHLEINETECLDLFIDRQEVADEFDRNRIE